MGTVNTLHQGRLHETANLPPSEGSAGNGRKQLDALTRAWLSFRVAVATTVVACGLLLGLAWHWFGGILVAALAALALRDALGRLRSVAATPVRTMLLDAASIGVAMLIVGAEPIAVWASLTYMLAVPVLLLPLRRAIPVIAYSAGWAVAAFVGLDVLQPAQLGSERIITAIVTVIFGVGTLALLAAVTHELERVSRDRDFRLEYERALAKCGEVLLASTEELAIDVALEALLAAVPAQNIFVDKNFDDPDLGLCARVTHEVIRPGYEDVVDEEIWVEPDAPETVSRTVLPYSEMPTSYAALSAGKPAVVVRSQLTGAERAIYDEDGCLSELNIPILAGGEWIGSIGIADYLTEREWSEDDQRILQTAGAMIGAFWERNAAYSQLEELIRSKDEFLASISHEIRTPLTAVLGFSSILHLESADLKAEVADQVAMIMEQAQEVADIVDDLLVAARADIDALQVLTQPVNLREEAQSVVANRVLHAVNPVTVSGDRVIAWADRSRVRQVVRCLVSNATRYGGEHVEIHIDRIGNLATLAVVDDGPGVPGDHEDHIFEAFRRAHARDGLPQAIGLGLYVARHLARLMNGELTYRREAGMTTFEVELPLAASAVI